MTLAIDMSNHPGNHPTGIPTQEEVRCLLDNGYTRAVVGCSYGTVAGAQIDAFAKGGMDTEVYAWIMHPFQPILVERALQVIANRPVTRLWLDAEDPSAEAHSNAAVRKDIQDAVDYVRKNAPHLRLGIYTGSWWWTPRTADWQETFGIPLWIANYRDPGNSLNESEIPGGWTKNDVAMWQYAGSVDTCGLNTDRNLVYAEEEEDMAIELIWCPDNQRLYVLGQGDPRWVTDQKAATDLQASYGTPKRALSWAALQALGAK